MAIPFSETLTAEKALIFRITHRRNLPWILANGLHCQSSDVVDPDFVRIGNPELIDVRKRRVVAVPPGGTLADYIPFYFTPYTPMLYNIKTGYGGIPPHRNEEIIVLVSSLHELKRNGVRYVFTDRHAKLQTATFFDDDSKLPDAVDFALLHQRDFKRDPERPDKVERYQAEALAYRHVPVAAILGVGCYTSAIKNQLEMTCRDLKLKVKVVLRTEWYFS
jgi:ssDNA thymidine ADP-ribosyltransferase, DarT